MARPRFIGDMLVTGGFRASFDRKQLLNERTIRREVRKILSKDKIRQPEVTRLVSLYKCSEEPNKILDSVESAIKRRNPDLENTKRLLKVLGETEGARFNGVHPEERLSNIIISNAVKRNVSDSIIEFAIKELGRLGEKGSEDAVKSLGYFAQFDDRHVIGGDMIAGFARLELMHLKDNDNGVISRVAYEQIGKNSVDGFYGGVTPNITTSWNNRKRRVVGTLP